MSLRAHAGAQEGGDLLEHLVAGEVAAGVVDHLELVEVEVEQHVLAPLGAGAADGALQADLELAAVDQAGQRRRGSRGRSSRAPCRGAG